MFDTMSALAADPASYATKKSAVETMRKILKTICLAEGSELMREVRKDANPLADTMLETLREVDDEELDDLINEGDGDWRDKVEEVARLAKDWCILPALSDVLVLLDAAAGEKQEASVEVIDVRLTGSLLTRSLLVEIEP